MDPKRVLTLKNKLCAYCGVDLENSYSKEHVIARKFVPLGTLNGAWNLILGACLKCNGIKSDLENDISAITIRACLNYKELKSDPDIMTIFESKGRAISRKTKKPVALSNEKIQLEVPHEAGLNLKFKIEGPPQINEVRAFHLAHFQVRSFFFVMTYNEAIQSGKWWEGSFVPVGNYFRADWGNERQISFMNNVLTWETKWISKTANGFHKAIIKKNPVAKCWSWALEWNKSFRIIGFFGDKEAIQNIVSNLSKLKVTRTDLPNGEYYLQRMEIPLKDSDDVMFDCEDLNP